MPAIETATVHRYLENDSHRSGIPQNALVIATPADYDDEKMLIVAVLPDLPDPETAAYSTELGVALAQTQCTLREAEPWGYMPCTVTGRAIDAGYVEELVAEAEEEEARLAALHIPSLVGADTLEWHTRHVEEGERDEDGDPIEPVGWYVLGYNPADPDYPAAGFIVGVADGDGTDQSAAVAEALATLMRTQRPASQPTTLADTTER